MFSLYDAVVPQFHQVLTGTVGLVAKAEAHCRAHDLPESALIEARLWADMQPFSFQVRSAAGHSAGAIAGLSRRSFSPDWSPLPTTFTALNQILDNAMEILGRVSREEVELSMGQTMRFESPTRGMDFTVEDYFLSFAMPNFYFHAATAYDILRANGVSLAKPDFVGPVRFKK